MYKCIHSVYPLHVHHIPLYPAILHRYFVLTDTKLLRYFEDEECQLFKGVINVQHIKKIEEADAIEPNYHFIITIEIAERVYLLNCYSENERQEWLSMLDEGQKTVNFDKDAAIFVGVKQQWNFNQTVESLPNQRLRYIIRIYEKWCVANKRFRTPTVSQTPQGVAGIPSIKTKMKRSPSTGFVCICYVFPMSFQCISESQKSFPNSTV